MRRLARRLLATLTTLSLLLCLATATLWVRSYWRADWLRHMSDHWEVWTVASSSGTLSLVYQPVDAGPSAPYWFVRSTAPGQLATFVPQWHHVGFSAARSSGTIAAPDGSNYPYRTYGFAGPHWVICLLLSILPCRAAAQFLLRRRAARRQATRHLCQCCAYDLTGNLSGICPECGTEIARHRVHV